MRKRGRERKGERRRERKREIDRASIKQRLLPNENEQDAILNGFNLQLQQYLR